MAIKDERHGEEIALLLERNSHQIRIFSECYFHRVLKAFSELPEEANQLQHAEFERLKSTSIGSDESSAGIAEIAYHQGVDFFLAVDSTRQAITNLMAVGIYHLFEQQGASLIRKLDPTTCLKTDSTLPELGKILLKQGIRIEELGSHSQLIELQLVANAIKHGEGRSAKELRRRRPQLFEDYQSSVTSCARAPLRPLVGEGIRLADEQVSCYAADIDRFWVEIKGRLYPDNDMTHKAT